MRRSIIGGRLPICPATTAQSILTPFSTFSGSGRGRGRGSSRFSPDPDSDAPPPPPDAAGHGRGRGTTSLPSQQQRVLPSFASFVAESGLGRGRGRGHSPFSPPPPPQPSLNADEYSNPLAAPPPQPSLNADEYSNPFAAPPPEEHPSSEHSTDVDFLSGMPTVGAGRGGGASPPQPSQEVNRHIGRLLPQEYMAESYEDNSESGATEEELNRHVRRPAEAKRPPPRRMSSEEAVKHALEVFAKAAEASGVSATAGRGAGMGRGRGRGRGQGRGRGMGDVEEETSRWAELYVGDDADAEKLESKLGRQVMKQLNEKFDEVVSKVLPSPVEEAHLSALDLKFALEFEPEYLMGDLDRNPDIAEKGPPPLRDILEKVKPFLMEFEGIESHQEWEEIVNETMERVPELKRIVDHYSGKDRITAKKQHQKLKSVAKTLPANIPDSIKQFTDRAVQSLQSNPGWAYTEKRRFLKSVVDRLSKHSK